MMALTFMFFTPLKMKLLFLVFHHVVPPGFMSGLLERMNSEPQSGTALSGQSPAG